VSSIVGHAKAKQDQPGGCSPAATLLTIQRIPSSQESALGSRPRRSASASQASHQRPMAKFGTCIEASRAFVRIRSAVSSRSFRSSTTGMVRAGRTLAAMPKVDPGVHEIQLLRVKAHAIVDDDGITLIDTGHAGSLPRIARAINGLGYSIDDIQRVVCTHGHPDHAGSAQAFADLGIDVWIHPDDAVNLDVGFADVIRHPSRGRVFAAMTPPLDRFKPLQDGLVLPALGGLEVVHTPGHTPGSVCLFAPRPGLLFVGDTLQRRFGRVSFASGLYSDDAAAARASVQRLTPLHVKTIVFSHYPALDEGAATILAGLARQAQAAS
jgi:glyoxylase-like metal-dependent hydrolase (beta-lactamase superfamily II)